MHGVYLWGCLTCSISQMKKCKPTKQMPGKVAQVNLKQQVRITICFFLHPTARNEGHGLLCFLGDLLLQYRVGADGKFNAITDQPNSLSL